MADASFVTHTTTPWWQRFETCSDRQQAQPTCSYRTIARTQCSIQQQADGTPVRKCERILQRFRDCPGRPLEELARSVEEISDSNWRRDSDGMTDPEETFSAPTPSEESVLQQDVGVFFEEFRKLAEELQSDTMRKESSQIPMEPGPLPRKRNIILHDEEQQPCRPSLWQWWSSRRQAANCQGASPNEKTWEHYEKDFQEV